MYEGPALRILANTPGAGDATYRDLISGWLYSSYTARRRHPTAASPLPAEGSARDTSACARAFRRGCAQEAEHDEYEGRADSHVEHRSHYRPPQPRFRGQISFTPVVVPRMMRCRARRCRSERECLRPGPWPGPGIRRSGGHRECLRARSSPARPPPCPSR
jgi:hypothetical protein